MNPRDVARHVLGRVDRGAYANLALVAELGKAKLADNDAALVTELVYGVLKRRSRLDRAVSALAPRGIDALDPATRDTLRMAAHQILFLRVPAHASVDDAVGAIKKARGDKLAGFANALLRRLAREGEPALPDDKVDLAAYLEVAESCPRWLVDDALRRLGPAPGRLLVESWNGVAPTWLRVNTERTDRDKLAAALLLERPRAVLAPSLLAPEALSVMRAGDVFRTESYGRGEFTGQDLGAQLIARLVDPQPDERILDACSGVGGKSTHLAALSHNRAHIDAADANERKLDLARDAAHRLGADRIRFVSADLTDAAAPLAPDYDRVLLDAPCSGLGVLRRHPELKWRRTHDEVKALATLQAQLLAALAPRVRPGGLLVYAVCTFTDEEGPLQIRAFLAAHPQFAVEPAPPDFAPLAAEEGAIRTWPHRDNADAFYAMRLRRRE